MMAKEKKNGKTVPSNTIKKLRKTAYLINYDGSVSWENVLHKLISLKRNFNQSYFGVPLIPKSQKQIKRIIKF